MCQIDQLEGRQLMTVNFSTTVYTASDQSGYAAITLNDSAALNGPLAPAPTQGPDQAYISTGGGTALAGVDYTPVHEAVTFQPGQSTQTIQIPVLPADRSNGTRIVQLDISSGPGAAPTDQAFLAIAHSSETTPPKVIASKMLTKGNSITGFVITFSKDMAADPVQDVRNYAVENPRSIRPVKGLQWATFSTLPLRSAVYNSATHSVTLTLGHKVKKFPFTFISDSQLQAAMNAVGQKSPSATALLPAISPITDSIGNPLDGVGDGTANGRLFADVASSGKIGKALAKDMASMPPLPPGN
jgi:hypothetical protein